MNLKGEIEGSLSEGRNFIQCHERKREKEIKSKGGRVRVRVRKKRESEKEKEEKSKKESRVRCIAKSKMKTRRIKITPDVFFPLRPLPPPPWLTSYTARGSAHPWKKRGRGERGREKGTKGEKE